MKKMTLFVFVAVLMVSFLAVLLPHPGWSDSKFIALSIGVATATSLNSEPTVWAWVRALLMGSLVASGIALTGLV